MYNFHYLNQPVSSIEIKGKNFDPTSDEKLLLSFDKKGKLLISVYDIDGNLHPIKNSSVIRKNIHDALLDEKWELFTMDEIEINGIFNDDDEYIHPALILMPQKPKKTNPFKIYFSEIQSIGFPLPEEVDILKKQSEAEYLHLYYRKENIIYHICINQFENIITTSEKFMKF